MNRRSAFTFLELMLAVTVLGLVMAAIFSTWSAGLNGWKRTVGVSDSFQRERIVMNTLADLTQSLVFFNNQSGLYSVTLDHNSQTGDSITFVTASNALLPPTEALDAGMRQVTISLQRDDRGHAFLGIVNNIALAVTGKNTEPESPHSLSAEVCGFAVRLRNPRDGTMMDHWTETNLPPSAIEYTVAFGANDGRIPPVIITRTFEVPVTPYAMELMGQALNPQDTTNTVKQGGGGDLNLVPGQSDSP